MEDVILDNLPSTANMILNILWDENREMTVPELMEAVNRQYHTHWEKNDIKQFADYLVQSDYVEKRYHRLKAYYIALGADFQSPIAEDDI